MPKTKYYVVWRGRRPGVFSSWAECERQVKGFVGAEFKVFATAEEAQRAYGRPYSEFRGKSASQGRWINSSRPPRVPSICVDAACSGSPGRLEYRGVDTETSRQLFAEGPFADGTNNVGEFLAIVHALRWLRERHTSLPIYSDSENAILWTRIGKCRTKLQRMHSNRRLFELIAEAEHSLGDDSIRAAGHVLKWDTAAWGEIPADYGRK